MSQPKDRRQARTRAAILAAAYAQIGETGVHRMSLRAVARAVDYSPAALYEYFPNKAALLDELAMRAEGALAAALAAAPNAPTPLVSLGQAYIAFAHARPIDFSLLFDHRRSGRRGLSTPAPPQGAYAVLLGRVRSGIIAETLPADADAETIAYAIWALSHGLATLQITHLAGFDADFPAADAAALTALIAGFAR